MKTPITDQDVLAKVSEILNSEADYGEQYEALDALWFEVINYHPREMAAEVLEVVSEAQRMTLYPEGR